GREEQIEDDKIIEIAQRSQSLVLSADRTVVQKLRGSGLDCITVDGNFDKVLKVNMRDDE
ncbi:MAG: hypothetical protein QXU18_12310, partial [Thermoplasmatales archaeon]